MNRLPELAWLQDFLALADSGNFSRAAQQRHSSQPAFSRRIRALEAWLGVALVDRRTQPAQLTEAGRWFRRSAQDLLARTGRLPGEAREVAQAAAVTLRIASTHALSFTFLPRWLRGLEARLPLGPVDLSSDVLARCEAQLQQGQVQFVLAHAHALVPGVLQSQDVVSTVVGSDELLPVARHGPRGRPEHRLDGRPGAGETASVPLLAYSDGSGLGRVLRVVLGRRLEAVAHQVVFTAHLASVLRSMVLDGRGLAWLPRSLVAEDLAAGRLVPAGGEGWAVPLEVRLVRPRAPLPPAAQAFWDAATDEAAATHPDDAAQRALAAR